MRERGWECRWLVFLVCPCACLPACDERQSRDADAARPASIQSVEAKLYSDRIWCIYIERWRGWRVTAETLRMSCRLKLMLSFLMEGSRIMYENHELGFAFISLSTGARFIFILLVLVVIFGRILKEYVVIVKFCDWIQRIMFWQIRKKFSWYLFKKTILLSQQILFCCHNEIFIIPIPIYDDVINYSIIITISVLLIINNIFEKFICIGTGQP